MEYATEPGAGTRSGVSWKNLAIRLLVPTLKVFDEYNAPLTRLLSNLPDKEQVILVGHGAGGLSLTDALHRFAKKNRMAIYVAASMLKLLKNKLFLNTTVYHGSDQDIKDHLKGLISASISGPYMEQGDPDVSEYGEVADLEYGMGLDQPPTSIIIKEEFQKRLLYHMSTREVRYLNVSSIKVSVTRSCFSILLDIRKWKTTGSGSFGSVWGSFFFFSIVFKLTESARCSANYKIKLSGAVVVSQSEVVEYCKPGGRVEHVYYVLKCIHYVKRDFWFANKATVLDLNRTNSQACATKSGLNTTIFTSSGMKTLQKAYMSSLSSLLAPAFIAIFNM
ncbi:hypothetical protein POTOM_044790 [Populus tomentosa]|uniref:DUF7731 domain-containing protein n=1 Tax=Populus tomentosa TaxID=118781 RepID=A0A8X7YK31_POPTO|nr:hypothetical protein POTOM_044790 [Populus tomentosa]